MSTTKDNPPRSRSRSLAITAFKATVSIGLLWLLLSRVDVARLWTIARTASPLWLLSALALYLGMILTSAWRWSLLLRAQGLIFSFKKLTSSFLVATFFNNFLPSNIGGDVIRIADTAPAAGSKTVATTIVLLDRGIGLLGLVLMAAIGVTLAPRLGDTAGALGASVLWIGFVAATAVATVALLFPAMFTRLLHPLRLLHAEWVDERIARLTAALSRFRNSPKALGGCFAGAIVVQTVLVAFYLAIAHSMRIPIGFVELAVIVPVTFIVQMIPLSMNGFGVREATFGFYFTHLGLPLESALRVSFVGAALIMLFSLSGGVAYLGRHAKRQNAFDPVLAED